MSVQLLNPKERFGLLDVLLATDERDDALQRSLVAQVVAHYLSRSLQDGMSVAIGMGRNVGAIPNHISNVSPRACRFISALGGSPQIALRSGIVSVLATSINNAHAILDLDKEREQDA